MSLTTDPNHPGVKRGPPDTSPVPQNETYLVMSETERKKGFLRPVRSTYYHDSKGGPRYKIRPLTAEELDRYRHCDYQWYEEFPQGSTIIGRFWSSIQIDFLREPCGKSTTMGLALSETYAANPWFYGATYCTNCRMHRPLVEFHWDDGEPMDPSQWSEELHKSVTDARKIRDEHLETKRV